LDIGTDVLTESLDILHWLGRIQPALIPKEHEEDIATQLESFYGFHAQPLAVKPEALSWGIPNNALEILENPEISEAYRRSLEIRSVL
jgi:glutathione S-transferase